MLTYFSNSCNLLCISALDNSKVSCLLRQLVVQVFHSLLSKVWLCQVFKGLVLASSLAYPLNKEAVACPTVLNKFHPMLSVWLVRCHSGRCHKLVLAHTLEERLLITRPWLKFKRLSVAGFPVVVDRSKVCKACKGTRNK